MASATLANDNELAKIGDRLTPRERRMLEVYRSLSAFEKARMRQEVARIVPLPTDRRRAQL